MEENTHWNLIWRISLVLKFMQAMCLLTAHLPETVKLMFPTGIRNQGIRDEASSQKAIKY